MDENSGPNAAKERPLAEPLTASASPNALPQTPVPAEEAAVTPGINGENANEGEINERTRSAQTLSTASLELNQNEEKDSSKGNENNAVLGQRTSENPQQDGDENSAEDASDVPPPPPQEKPPRQPFVTEAQKAEANINNLLQQLRSWSEAVDPKKPNENTTVGTAAQSVLPNMPRQSSAVSQPTYNANFSRQDSSTASPTGISIPVEGVPTAGLPNILSATKRPATEGPSRSNSYRSTGNEKDTVPAISDGVPTAAPALDYGLKATADAKGALPSSSTTHQPTAAAPLPAHLNIERMGPVSTSEQLLTAPQSGLNQSPTTMRKVSLPRNPQFTVAPNRQFSKLQNELTFEGAPLQQSAPNLLNPALNVNTTQKIMASAVMSPMSPTTPDYSSGQGSPEPLLTRQRTSISSMSNLPSSQHPNAAAMAENKRKNRQSSAKLEEVIEIGEISPLQSGISNVGFRKQSAQENVKLEEVIEIGEVDDVGPLNSIQPKVEASQRKRTSSVASSSDQSSAYVEPRQRRLTVSSTSDHGSIGGEYSTHHRRRVKNAGVQTDISRASMIQSSSMDKSRSYDLRARTKAHHSNPDLSRTRSRSSRHSSSSKHRHRSSSHRDKKEKEEYAPLKHLKRKMEQNGNAGTTMKNINKWISRRANVYYIRLWVSTIKQVEGKFGTSVASYFVLQRWVMLLNLILATLWTFFIVLPGFVNMASNDKSDRNLDTFPAISTVYLTGPSAEEFNLALTPLFYTGYTPKVKGNYSMDYAYIIVTFVFFASSFLVIVRSMRQQYVTRSYITSNFNVDELVPFASTAFAAWDFAITTAESRQNHASAITTVFKSLLDADRLKASREKEFQENRVTIILLRCLTLFASAGIVGVSFIIMFQGPSEWWAEQVPWLSSGLTLTICNVIFPPVIRALTRSGKWFDPAIENTISLCWTFVLKIAGLGFILFRQGALAKRGDLWEFKLGSAFYQLILLDAVTTILISLAEANFWVLVLRRRYEFDVSSSALEIIYRQSIIWMGSMFSPAIPFISLLSTFIIFGVKKLCVMQFASPPRKLYSSSTQTFYFLIFFGIALVFAMGPIWYMVINLPVNVGPFYYMADVATMNRAELKAMMYPPNGTLVIQDEPAYHTFTELLRQEDIVNSVVERLQSVTVLGPVILFLGLWIYFLLASVEKSKQRLGELQEEVKGEREDKKFLMRFYDVKT